METFQKGSGFQSLFPALKPIHSRLHAWFNFAEFGLVFTQSMVVYIDPGFFSSLDKNTICMKRPNLF